MQATYPGSYSAGVSVFVLKINSDKFLFFLIYREFGLMYFLDFHGTDVFHRIQGIFFELLKENTQVFPEFVSYPIVYMNYSAKGSKS